MSLKEIVRALREIKPWQEGMVGGLCVLRSGEENWTIFKDECPCVFGDANTVARELRRILTAG